jgi:hypothetical protein
MDLKGYWFPFDSNWCPFEIERSILFIMSNFAQTAPFNLATLPTSGPAARGELREESEQAATALQQLGIPKAYKSRQRAVIAKRQARSAKVVAFLEPRPRSGLRRHRKQDT